MCTTQVWCSQIKFVLLLQLILKNAVSVTVVQIVGDMESTGGDDNHNAAEKCHNGGERQYNTAGSNACTAVLDRTSPPHRMPD